MRNKITDLRNHLFATIEALLDDENPMEVKRALAVAEVASVVVEAAKVEVMHIRQTGALGTGFIPSEGERRLGTGEKETV